MITLHAYVLRELLKTFGLAILALTALFTMGGGLYNVVRSPGVTAASLLSVHSQHKFSHSFSPMCREIHYMRLPLDRPKAIQQLFSRRSRSCVDITCGTIFLALSESGSRREREANWRRLLSWETAFFSE